MKFVNLVFFSSFLCAASDVYLEPNMGQERFARGEANSSFLARTAAGTIAAGPSRVAIFRTDGSRSDIVFDGASNRAHGSAEQPLPGVSHYVHGSDPDAWVWGVPRYGAVRYKGIYSGVDLFYHASGRNLEFDFVVAPGGNPSRIRLRVPREVRIASSGALAMPGGWIRSPIAWQIIGGKRVPVDARFGLVRPGLAALHLGRYEKSLPLTIDPVIEFATFLGGSGDDIATRVAAGPDGAIYVAGNTNSADFPASLSPVDLLARPTALVQPTAFVSRLKADASALDWSLFIGGSARQSVFALKLDPFGNIYLLGGTTSPNFPVTPSALHGAIDPSLTDIFLVKLDAQTGRVKASTFLGIPLYVNLIDAGALLAIDAAGGIYIGGARLYGGDFTPNSGAWNARTNNFVLRLNSAMNAVVYSTFWNLGSMTALEVDSGGNLWIGGVANGSPQSGTPPFPALNPLPGINQKPAVPGQAYIARLNASGTALLSATLIHGDGRGSEIDDIKLAPDSSLYVVGTSDGTFPVVNPLTLDPHPSTTFPPSTGGAFLVRLSPEGQGILQSTLFPGIPFGGTSFGISRLRLVLDPNSSPCIGGLNTPAEYQTPGAVPLDNSNFGAAWSFSCVDSAGVKLGLKTRLPGAAGYRDLAFTSDGAVLFVGGAIQFPTTAGVLQPGFGGTPAYRDYYSTNAIPPGDGFLLKLSLQNPVPAIANVFPEQIPLNSNSCQVAAEGSGFAAGATVTLNGKPVTYTAPDSRHLTISLDCSAIQPGDNALVMTIPAPGGGVSTHILTGTNPPPASLSVSPSSVTQGAGETKLVIRAPGLSTASVLYWNSSSRSAAFVLDFATSRTGHLEILLQPAELAQPASIPVYVENPAPGGGTSPAIRFNVQPLSGEVVPVLANPTPFTFGASPLGPDISFTGSGFSAATRAFWNGTEVPVTALTATRITLRPPAQDLLRIAAHDLYVTNGVLRSATVRVLIARALPTTDNQVFYSAAASVYDGTRKRLYVVAAPNNTVAADLFVFDIPTGNVINAARGILSGAYRMALSADGNYVYISGSAASAPAIVRYSAAAEAVDLRWQVPTPEGQSPDFFASIVTPPDAPETVIASTQNGQVTIFDRDVARPFDSTDVRLPSGFRTGQGALFATANKIYFSPLSGCLTWLDYDAFGVSGGQPNCSLDTPDLKRDGALNYLTDGARTVATSFLSFSSGTTLPSSFLVANLAQRRVLTTASSVAASSALQILSYDLDQRQFRILTPTTNFFSQGLVSFFPLDDGAVLMVLPTSIVLIP